MPGKPPSLDASEQEWARNHPIEMEPEQFGAALDNARRQLFGASEPRRAAPKVIILAGQPGAGKTALTRAAVKEFASQGGSVVIDPDELRDFVPGYRKLAEENYRTASTRSQPLASDFARELRKLAMGEKRNIIIDGTLRHPPSAVELVRDLKNAGYDVEIRAMAVPSATSERGVAWRLEQTLSNNMGVPRTVNADVQREAVENFPESLRLIQKSGMASRITVNERGNSSPIYDSNAPNRQYADARDAVVARQTRPPTPLEKAEAAKDWEQIAKWGQARNAPELALYQARSADAHARVRADPEAASIYENMSSVATAKAAGMAANEARKLAQTPHEGSVPHQTPKATPPHEETPITRTAAAGAWSTRLNGVNAKIGAGAIVINLADAALKRDPKKAAIVVGSTAAVHFGLKGVEALAGVKTVPIAGQMVGAGFAGYDSYASFKHGDKTRGWVSATEAGLYTVSATAGAAAAFNFWNPAGWGAAGVSAVAGVGAVSITAGKAVYDNWGTVKGWFSPYSGGQHTDAAGPRSDAGPIHDGVDRRIVAPPPKAAQAPVTTAALDTHGAHESNGMVPGARANSRRPLRGQEFVEPQTVLASAVETVKNKLPAKTGPAQPAHGKVTATV